MSMIDNVVGERESEFTGLKGAILCYVGNVYTLLLAALFLAAFADAYPAVAWLLDPLSWVTFAAAIVVHPVKKWFLARHASTHPAA